MSDSELIPLFDHFEEIIDSMPRIFTSHQFILALAKQYQTEYVEALYAHRFDQREGRTVPFMNVHRELSVQLKQYPHRIQRNRSEVKSKDIFGNDNTCAEWRKI